MADASLHEKFMKAALTEAKKAYEDGEIPIGAVIVHQNKIIAKGYNQVQKLKDTTAHAEMIAITSASNYLGAKYLMDCSLYVTLEPCPMCAGAIRWAQIPKLIYGSKDEKAGYSHFSEEIIHKKVEIIAGILEKESLELIQLFFQNLRS